MSHSWPLPPSPCSLSPLLHSPSPKHRDHPRVGLETQGKDRETQPASVSACPTRVRGLRELAPATACPEAHTQNCAHFAKRTPALHFGLCASWAFPMSSSALASNSALPPPRVPLLQTRGQPNGPLCVVTHSGPWDAHTEATFSHQRSPEGPYCPPQLLPDAASSILFMFLLLFVFSFFHFPFLIFPKK